MFTKTKFLTFSATYGSSKTLIVLCMQSFYVHVIYMNLTKYHFTFDNYKVSKEDVQETQDWCKCVI